MCHLNPLWGSHDNESLNSGIQKFDGQECYGATDCVDFLEESVEMSKQINDQIIGQIFSLIYYGRKFILI